MWLLSVSSTNLRDHKTELAKLVPYSFHQNHKIIFFFNFLYFLAANTESANCGWFCSSLLHLSFWVLALATFLAFSYTVKSDTMWKNTSFCQFWTWYFSVSFNIISLVLWITEDLNSQFLSWIIHYFIRCYQAFSYSILITNKSHLFCFSPHSSFQSLHC